MQQSHRTSPGLKLLLAAAAAALLACVAVVVMLVSGMLPATRGVITSILAGVFLIVVAIALVLLEVLVRAPRRAVLEYPVEMSTLTFPPVSAHRTR